MAILNKELERIAKRAEKEQNKAFEACQKRIQECLTFLEYNQDIEDVQDSLEACAVAGLNVSAVICSIGEPYRITAYKDGGLSYSDTERCTIRIDNHDWVAFYYDDILDEQIDMREYYVDCDMVDWMSKPRFNDYTFLDMLEGFIKSLKDYIPVMKEFITNMNIYDYGYTER